MSEKEKTQRGWCFVCGSFLLVIGAIGSFGLPGAAVSFGVVLIALARLLVDDNDTTD